MMQEQWLTRLLVICAMCSEATEKLKVPYDFAAYPSYKSYYKLRQNDKFLYKNPKQKYYYTKPDGSSTFSINEELSPNGITHGGYGYLDQNGDLIYIEYEKDQNGLVAKTDTKIVQRYHQSPISDSNPIEISQSHNNNRPSRAISPYEIEYGFVPIKGEPNLYHKEYYIKKQQQSISSKPYELPDFGPPYRDNFVIQNQIHGTFQKTSKPYQKTTTSTTAKPKKQYNKSNAHPYVPPYHQPTAKGKYEDQERHYAPIQNLNTIDLHHHTKSIQHENHGTKEVIPLPIMTPTPGSVGYQQIVVHGVDTYYDIPKQEKKKEKRKSSQEKHVKKIVSTVPPYVKHERITPDFRVWKEPLNPIIPVITEGQTLRNDFHPQPLFRTEQKISDALPKKKAIDHGKFGKIYHHRGETTLPPLVISALPKVFEEGRVKPFLASTPATYLVNPSTTVSTLRPVIRPKPTQTIVKTSTTPNYGPRLNDVTVLSHGEKASKGFPFPPIPTFRNGQNQIFAYTRF